MEKWEIQKKWSDKFLTEIKSILGIYLIGESSKEEDCSHNTDLIVLKLEAVRIACRIRKNVYLEKYGNEFTVRAKTFSGCKTELTKIIEGWGNYFFYGFSTSDEKHLEQWILGDLNAFRIWFNRELRRLKGDVPGNLQKNHGYDSFFYAFELNKIPNFIIAKNEVNR